LVVVGLWRCCVLALLDFYFILFSRCYCYWHVFMRAVLLVSFIV